MEGDEEFIDLTKLLKQATRSLNSAREELGRAILSRGQDGDVELVEIYQAFMLAWIKERELDRDLLHIQFGQDRLLRLDLAEARAADPE